MLVRSGHPLGCVRNNGIADRASALADAEVIEALRERVVPVAVDQHVHRRLKTEEGALFAAVLAQASRGLGGTSQGVYLFTPGGKLLAFSNTADAGDAGECRRISSPVAHSPTLRPERPRRSTLNDAL